MLWNKELQPKPEVYQRLLEVYQKHAPSIIRPYEEVADAIAILNQLGEMTIDSGYFQDMRSGHVEVKVTYSVDEYLLLLNTYSPYLKLEESQKQALFAQLQNILKLHGNTLELSYISAFHIIKPIKSGIGQSRLIGL